MVRVKHFTAVPDAGVRKDIRRLNRTQLLLEGKSPTSSASASTMSLTSRTIARSKSVASGTPLAKAEQIIEVHLPREVAWYRGSLASGKLAFQLPISTLHITLPETGIFLEHHIQPENGDGITRCQIIGSVETNPILQATEIIELVQTYLTTTFTVSKASLTQRIKETLIPTRAMELHDLLRKDPRSICKDANVARFGWHFLRADSILDKTLESRFFARIKELRSSLNALTLAEIEASVPLASRSKSKAQMIDYLLEPQFTFHGPKAEFINNIAQHGLLAAGDINPSTGERIPGRLGSTYGPGVYVTDEAHLALTYADWNRCSLLSINALHRLPGVTRKRMIICAAALGRAALVTPADGFRNKLTLFEGAHSHVANGGQEFVLPPSQVLPLYAVDFDWIPTCPEQRANYIDYAATMVNPPKDSVEKQGRWFQFERKGRK